MEFLWLGLAAVFAAVEGVTVQVVSVWFAIGSVGGMIAALCGASVTMQILIAAVVSVITLLLFRPFIVKVLKPEQSDTNIDSLIGRRLIVTETIDNIKNEGVGKINGLEWKLRSEDGENISSGSEVEIKGIRGVTLIVSPVKETVHAGE